MALRVLFCTSEAVPFAKTGGLADVAGALPPALAKLGHDIRIALPKYAAIDSSLASAPIAGPFKLKIADKAVEFTIEQSDALSGVPTYLIDCPAYYDRDGLYGHPDDAERYALFCRAILHFIEAGDWTPDVIHGNDWQTALIPVYLKTTHADRPGIADIGTLHTIHNLAYQGVFDPPTLSAVGLDRSLFTMDGLEFYGRVNFLKGGLLFADVLNTVSKKYAEEIQTPDYGERLEGILTHRKNDLFGILNGLDYDEWNPATDAHIDAAYDAGDVRPKAKCKVGLQRRFKLPERPDVPLFGLVSRLAGQKGLDILAEVIPHLLKLDVQFALLGTGEQYYHDVLSALAEGYPEKMGLALTFDNALAHQIYAGSDMFLMPSHYEPCGLGQMISLRYGTIPVVRSTGGLADTIDEFDPQNGRGNGFVFDEYRPVALLGTAVRGILTYGKKAAWAKLVENAMAANFSWDRSAQEYAALYERAIEKRRSR